MRLGLFGRGRMGREVERVAVAARHEIAFALDSTSQVNLRGVAVDVMIDFTRADAVARNVRQAAEARLPIVVGTTGWQEDLAEVRRLVEAAGIGLVYGSNFSIGANIFFSVVEEAARRFNGFPEYDPYVVEHHHRGKVDAPSGTARELARRIMGVSSQKTRVVTGNPEGALAADALHVTSIRAGAAFGRHQVGFDGASDSVELVHVAHSREGFAKGAVFAAEWIRERKGVFEFGELLEESHG